MCVCIIKLNVINKKIQNSVNILLISVLLYI